MANDRDRTTDDPNTRDEEIDESQGGTREQGQPGRPGQRDSERVSGTADENMRGTGDDADMDDFEETEDLDDEDEGEPDGTI